MSKLILVVEDEANIAELVTTALTEILEQQTIVAINGREALDYLASPSNPLPDLIITNIAMPEVDGPELARAVKEKPQTRHIPIVAISAHQSSLSPEITFKLGFDAFIAKPFDLNELVEKARELLELSGEGVTI